MFFLSLCVFVCVCPLYRELSKIRDHDVSVSQQVAHSHQKLAAALTEPYSDLKSVKLKKDNITLQFMQSK